MIFGSSPTVQPFRCVKVQRGPVACCYGGYLPVLPTITPGVRRRMSMSHHTDQFLT